MRRVFAALATACGLLSSCGPTPAPAAQPTPYVPATSFAAYQIPPGVNLDGEYGAIRLTLDQILLNLAILQRDDTALANGIVTPDSLSDETKALISASGAGLPVGIAYGGTGATTAAAARTSLGLATIAATGAPADLVSAVPVSKGGTGQTSAGEAALDAITGFASTGTLVRTGSAAYAFRTLTGPAEGLSVTNGNGVAGNPTLALANDLSAIEALSSTGLLVRFGTDQWIFRNIAAGSGITVTNGGAVSGNPTVALTAPVTVALGGTNATSASGTALDNITGFASTGAISRTGAGTYAFRTLTAPAAGITVSNGNGVSGNPTLALANDLGAVEGLAANGVPVRTATDTWAIQRDGEAAWCGTTAGTANAQTCSLSPAATAYTTGMRVMLVAGNTNTGATTIAVNGLATKNIFSNGAALTGGEILSGKPYYLVYDGTQFDMISPVNSGHGGLIGMQYFQTAGTSTYTPTAGTRSVLVECVAGGGGGGGAALTGAAQVAMGAGGGGGGYARARITASFSGVTVTVGAKGTGGTAGANNGVAGGSSSFGALVVASGGGAGTGGGAGSAPAISGSPGGGGVGTTGDLGVAGTPGGFGLGLASTGFGVLGAAGGNSIWGAGGVGAISATGAAGNAGTGVGSGGAGGFNIASQGTGKAGGDGTAGACAVWEFN